MTLKHHQNIVTSTTEQCSQLFFVFTGLGGRLLLMSPFEFLQQTGLAKRNFVIFKDPLQLGYRQGISAQIPNLDALHDWQREFIRERPYIRDVYCIGVSAGAIPAMISGHRLRVNTVWSFSARSPSRLWTKKYGSARPQNSGVKPWLRQKLKNASMRLRKMTNRPARERFDKSLIDVEFINDSAVELSQHNGKTEYRLLYADTNATDIFVHQLLAECPGVTSLPVSPPSDSPDRFRPGWDHMLLPILHQQGGLGQLFPPFAPVGTEQ
jgi:hypothetical protein